MTSEISERTGRLCPGFASHSATIATSDAWCHIALTEPASAINFEKGYYVIVKGSLEEVMKALEEGGIPPTFRSYLGPMSQFKTCRTLRRDTLGVNDKPTSAKESDRAASDCH